MLLKSYAVFPTLLSLSLASTHWNWKGETPTGNRGHIDFKFEFWKVAQGVGFLGSDGHADALFVTLKTGPDNYGRSQVRAQIVSWTQNASPDSPNCHGDTNYVYCEIPVDADYASLFTINVSPVDGSSTNSWKATLYVEDRNYEIGRIALPQNLQGLDNNSVGYLEDTTGHDNCSRKSPIHVNTWAPVLNGNTGTLSGFYESTHCPGEDTPVYQNFGDHWSIQRS